MKDINEKKVVFFIIIIMSLIISGTFCCVMLFGGAKRVASEYAKGMQLFDSTIIANLYIEEMIKESYNSKEDMIKEFDDLFKDMEDSYFKILKYKIDKNYKLYENNEFEYQKDVLVDYYKLKEKDIKEIRRYTVTFYCSDDGDDREVEHKLNIAKIGGKWYLISTE